RKSADAFALPRLADACLAPFAPCARGRRRRRARGRNEDGRDVGGDGRRRIREGGTGFPSARADAFDDGKRGARRGTTQGTRGARGRGRRGLQSGTKKRDVLGCCSTLPPAPPRKGEGNCVVALRPRP